jgi:hypothetical protein
MNKKIMMLALTVISAASFVLPRTAAAEDIPLHLLPKPEKATPIVGGIATLIPVGGIAVTCEKTEGNAVWETSTTGSVTLTFKNCKAGIFGICNSEGQPAGTIKTNALPFHLLTVPVQKPGILVTPAAAGGFTVFACGGLILVAVEGNGVVGTITKPNCGEEGQVGVIAFEGVNGVQKHKKVEGTEVAYNLVAEGKEAALSATLEVIFPPKTKLVCT